MKVKVIIEEHLSKEITVDIPNDTVDAFELAHDKILNMYNKEEIVLGPDDYNGTTLIQMSDESGRETEWYSL